MRKPNASNGRPKQAPEGERQKRSGRSQDKRTPGSDPAGPRCFLLTRRAAREAGGGASPVSGTGREVPVALRITCLGGEEEAAAALSSLRENDCWVRASSRAQKVLGRQREAAGNKPGVFLPGLSCNRRTTWSFWRLLQYRQKLVLAAFLLRQWGFPPLILPLSWLERWAMAGSGYLALLLTASLQSLLHPAWGQGSSVDNSTAGPTSVPPTSSSKGLSKAELEAAIAVPCVFVGLLLIGLLVFMGLKIREKRQTEGTYRPSNEEQAGARVEPQTNLKLPPEERLI
ncbi:protein crumbs homolog 3 [Ahaetulla prasina]|uniref:protein crumbs homolog 3 n=1 Tax=Ahaetulla prasina TaxID=499056 RepID=UPI002649E78F|nr:protein crumbs homolog 3 [Ahaetulla prasina]